MCCDNESNLWPFGVLNCVLPRLMFVPNFEECVALNNMTFMVD